MTTWPLYWHLIFQILIIVVMVLPITAISVSFCIFVIKPKTPTAAIKPDTQKIL